MPRAFEARQHQLLQPRQAALLQLGRVVEPPQQALKRQHQPSAAARLRALPLERVEPGVEAGGSRVVDAVLGGLILPVRGGGVGRLGGDPRVELGPASGEPR